MFYKLFLTMTLTLLLSHSAAAQTISDDADSEYIKCLQSATQHTDNETAICMGKEIKRLDQEINNFYNNVFLKEAQVQKWNNGNGMFRGNLKDMQDQFNSYRVRFCSLYSLLMQNYSSSQLYLRNECMMQLTNEYYIRIRNMARSYKADLD